MLEIVPSRLRLGDRAPGMIVEQVARH